MGQMTGLAVAPQCLAALERANDVRLARAQLKRRVRGGSLRRTARMPSGRASATWFGWMNRTLESTAEPEGVPWLWRQYAYRGYLALQQLDRAVLERRLPPAIFYNLLISARKP